VGTDDTTAFLEHRILLKPTIIVDERFNIKSDLIFGQVLGGPNNTPSRFGNTLDGTGNESLVLKRAWMEWASDWGILRVGRQPKSWGLGILYHAGDHVLDSYGTTVDRVGFQALLGNLGFNVGYEKVSEGLINSEFDDGEAYEISLDYSSPETLTDVGILWTRTVISAGAIGLGGRPSSAHDLSIFSTKKWGQFQLGGEFVSTKYDSSDSVIGALAQADYQGSAFVWGADLGFATAGNKTSFTFNPNYRPFVILFNQTLGASSAVASHLGADANGNATNVVGGAVGDGSGRGAILGKINFGYGFSNKTYLLGTDLGYAKLAKQGSNSSSALGVEWDLHLKQKWYDNFDTFYGLGFLFPGEAFGTQKQVAWGFQMRGALKF
jgi:hypothetical protein